MPNTVMTLEIAQSHQLGVRGRQSWKGQPPIACPASPISRNAACSVVGLTQIGFAVKLAWDVGSCCSCAYMRHPENPAILLLLVSFSNHHIFANLSWLIFDYASRAKKKPTVATLRHMPCESMLFYHSIRNSFGDYPITRKTNTPNTIREFHVHLPTVRELNECPVITHTPNGLSIV